MRGTILSRIGAVLLAALFLAGCDRPHQLKPLHEGSIVLAFGDSLTHGTGAPKQQSYPQQLGRLIPGKLVTSAVPGETSDRGLKRLPRILEEIRPDLVLLCHGGNDILQRREGVSTAANLRQMITMIQESGAEVILLAVPKPGLFLSASEIYEEVAEEMDVPLENDVIPSVLADNSLKSDLIHPNARGYEKIARAVARLLERSGAI